MTQIDDTQVKTRRKRTLDRIRERERINADVSERHNAGSNGPVETAIGSFSATPRTDERNATDDARRVEGMESEPRTNGGYDSGIRPVDESSINPASGIDRDDNQIGASQLAPEEEEERKKELHRQRQQRYIDRQKAKNEDNLSFFPSESRQKTPDGKAHIQFKNPLKRDEAEPVKLFTQKEVDEKKDKLLYVYLHGSGLLDDILEIIVKGHEKVEIWQLDDAEAAMLADMHLDRAKTDQAAARSARTLIALYDRIYYFMLFGPRMIATGQHINRHGGLSFK